MSAKPAPIVRNRRIVVALFVVGSMVFSACSSSSPPTIVEQTAVIQPLGVAIPSTSVPEPTEFVAQTGDELGQVPVDAPDAEQIKADLQQVNLSDIGTIPAPHEFLDLAVIDSQPVTKSGIQKILYRVEMLVRQPTTGVRWQGDATVVYVQDNGAWNFESYQYGRLVTVSEPVPTPPQDVVTGGQPARLGAFTVVVHGWQMVEAVSSSTSEQLLYFDVSMRNESSDPVQDQFRFTVLGPDGTRLNSQFTLSKGNYGLLPAEMQTRDCVSRQFEFFDNVVQFPIIWQPGDARRTWVSYKLTPGLEEEGLEFEVDAPGPRGDPQRYTATFALQQPIAGDALLPRWTEGNIARETSIGSLIISDGHLGPSITNPNDQLPCRLPQSELTVHLKNTGSTTVLLDMSQAQIIDADGRRHRTPLGIWNTSFQLDPQSEADATISFILAYGLRDQPIALILPNIAANQKEIVIAVQP